MTPASPSQAKVYRYLWQNPGANLRVAARDLHMTWNAVKIAKHRLRRRPDIGRLCPECFQASFYSLVCALCGFEGERPTFPEGLRFEYQTPVHSIQPLGGLGSQTEYGRLGLAYGGRNIAHLVERSQERFLEQCRSDLWEELKATMPDDAVAEEAARLLVKEVSEFRVRYPLLVSSKYLRRQLVENVVLRLALLHPALRRPHSEEVTTLQ